MSLSNLLLDSQTTAILWLDAGQRCLYLNPAAEDLLQISGREAARGRRLAGLLPFAHDWCQALRDTGQPATWREYHIPLSPPEAGKHITVDCTVTPLNQQDLPGITLLVELTPLDRHLLISREKHLQEEQLTRRALLRGLAHEIRNPLGGLRGAAQLLERELPDSELREYTSVIMREADRLRGLVDALLGSPRALQTRPNNVHELLAHVIRLIEVEGLETRSKPPAIMRDYDPSLPEIAIDDEQLIQVLLNLMRNAITAMNSTHDGNNQLALRTRALRQYTLGT
ncbi:MAG TPA: histidine kinase dimerization/phospho-acceptor domain-containing protein, partial [Gammaproteobacteria bacterium]|nr:histidine kinase dimerization/phospho-acceptor domain-containing protein [Gammaproteobacteria bacterium]